MRRVSNTCLRARHVARTFIVCAAIAAITAGCAVPQGSSDNACQRCTPREELGDSLHFFDEGKTLYWVGAKLAGYYVTAARPDPDGRLHATVVYQSEAETEDTTLEIRTFDPAQHEEPFDYPPIATVHTATGQLVIFDTPGGYRPSREVLARLVKALRPVTEADISQLPDNWYEIAP